MVFITDIYSGKLKKCKKCNGSLIITTSGYYTSKNKQRTCMHKKCVKCNINYVKDGLYRIISEEGMNSNVAKLGEPIKTTNVIQEGSNDFRLHVTTFSGELFYCPTCNSELNTSKVKYKRIEGGFAYCKVNLCSKCKINYMSRSSFGVISSFGDNPYVVLDRHLEHISQKQLKEVPIPISKGFEEVYVYKSINNRCNINHPQYLDFIPMTMKNVKNNNTCSLKVFYCQKCNKKFITIEAITKYSERNYIPQFRCNLQEFEGDLKEVSLLRLYGYTVQKGILSKEDRHAIIDFVIEHNIMTPNEVISLLEFNLKFVGAKRGMEDACEKWHDDIQYVYKVNVMV